MSTNIIGQYEQRLKNLPEVSPQIASQIKKYEQLIDDQNSQITIQSVKIKAMESELLKFDKQLEKIQNQINELSETESKNANKEKKYLMQIDNYNKKIETAKAEIAKVQKSVTLLKKQIKTLQSYFDLQKQQTVSIKSDKTKIEQTLTKQQIKINSLTQTLNDLKLKIMQQGGGGGQQKNNTDIGAQIERDEKQIGELFNAIKKQMALIDVLKRQKVHLIASTVFRHCQEEFEKVLEMNKDK